MKLLFVLYLMAGIVKPQDSHEGRKTYRLITKNAVYEHAYKEEIMEYIKTRTFEYNEDLK
jgi:hypothetical protein